MSCKITYCYVYKSQPNCFMKMILGTGKQLDGRSTSEKYMCYRLLNDFWRWIGAEEPNIIHIFSFNHQTKHSIHSNQAVFQYIPLKYHQLHESQNQTMHCSPHCSHRSVSSPFPPQLSEPDIRIAYP